MTLKSTDLQANSRRWSPYLTTAAYYLTFIGLGSATAVLGPTLQALAKNTASTLAQISSLFLLSSFGYLLGSFAAGRIYDRVKGHPVISLVLVLIAGMMVVVPLMQVLLYLQIIFFLVGIAEGILDVGANTLIVWLHGERVPPFMNGLHAFYGIGTTLAPLIVAAVLAGNGSLNSVYWALTGLILPAGLFILFSPSPSHILARKQAEERPAIPITVFLASLIFFAFTGAELGFGGWIYTFTTSQAYGSPTLAASINAAYWGAFTVGRLISIPLAVKLKPQKILALNFGGAILSLLIIIFFSKTAGFLWLGTLGTGLFNASAFPTLLNYAQSKMHMTGKVTSWFFVGSSLGSMVLPWIMGLVITPYGATSVMIAVLCSTVLAASIFYYLDTRQHSLPPPQTESPQGEAVDG